MAEVEQKEISVDFVNWLIDVYAVLADHMGREDEVCAACHEALDRTATNFPMVLVRTHEGKADSYGIGLACPTCTSQRAEQFNG